MNEQVSRATPDPRAPGAARAYARLLVSDVRLYHEDEVITGRARRDLARRLGGPIARARSRFLSRFDDPADFEKELIRILAGGNSALLG